MSEAPPASQPTPLPVEVGLVRLFLVLHRLLSYQFLMFHQHPIACVITLVAVVPAATNPVLVTTSCDICKA
jgi:hypothetical protein